MRKTRTLGIAAGAIIAVLLTAIPASAYYITGWQTNSGWNSIDGCSVYRLLELEYVSATDYLCARDVGVRTKGTYNAGGTWDNTYIRWDSYQASQNAPFNGHVTAMKVYHGDH